MMFGYKTHTISRLHNSTSFFENVADDVINDK